MSLSRVKPAEGKAATTTAPASDDGNRNRQLERLLELIVELSRAGGRTLKELAERHHTTTRTIRRDFDALRGVGLEVEEDGDGASIEKRWRIDSKRSSAKLKRLLDARDAIAARRSSTTTTRTPRQ